MKNFVTAKWLIENIDDKDLVVLDTRAELSDPLEGRRQYNKSHIEGAHFISLKDTLAGSVKSQGGRHPLPDLNKFVKEMEEMGISNLSKLVIYDDGSIAMAGRLWWIFKYIGKENIYILKGGIEAYKEEKGKLTSKVPEITETGELEISINEDIKADMEYVRENIHNEDTAIVDVRAYERYIGKVEPLDRIAGHIENALNYPWKEVFKDGKLLDLKEIKDKFKALEEYKEIIVHCGSGITGTVMVLLLDELDIDAKLYAGGYSDWISYKGNKVVKGES